MPGGAGSTGVLGGQTELERFLHRYPVSRETQRDLQIYADLLVKWQKAYNLVGPGTLSELWTRHILDSIQLLDLAPQGKTWVDLGSGAGLPGMVLAIGLKEKPGALVTLIESNGKKAGFLRHVAGETKARAKILQGRVEVTVPTLAGVDIVTARALAPLSQLLDWSEPLLKSGAEALFHKGRDLDKEIADAARYWDFKHEALPSVVASDSWVLRIRAARRKTLEN